MGLLIRRLSLALAGASAASALASCAPDLAVDETTITYPRVLAIVAEPAEAPPGATVTLRAIWADPAGPVADAPLTWSFCTARRLLTESTAVSAVCADDGEHQLPVAGGLSATATLPNDGCERFGPNPPPAEVGEPAGRPSDPDPTGGYFQPLRVLEPGGTVIGRVRIGCGASGATQATAAELARRYHKNRNPDVSRVVVSGTTLAEGSPPPRVAPGETVTLVVGWPTCPNADVCEDGVCGADEDATLCAADCLSPAAGPVPGPLTCAGAERYVVFNSESRGIDVRREAMRVSWYATAGTFREARGGVSSSSDASELENGWTAPTEPGSVRLWAVLRDDRGGAGAREFTIEVAAP